MIAVQTEWQPDADEEGGELERDQVLPNEDLVARRGGRPSLPGTRQDLERRRRKALRCSD